MAAKNYYQDIIDIDSYKKTLTTHNSQLLLMN